MSEKNNILENKRIEIKHVSSLDIFDTHEGRLRTERKIFDRTQTYRGIEIKRNKNVPQGADGRIDIPTLKWWGKGEMQTGFLTVSWSQAYEAIDNYIKYNL